MSTDSEWRFQGSRGVTPFRVWTSVFLALALAPACRATIPDNVFACERDRDCPPGLGCNTGSGLCARAASSTTSQSGEPSPDGPSDRDPPDEPMMGEPTEEGEPGEPECDPDGRDCEGRMPLRCSEGGEWLAAQAECATACLEGECVPCQQGEQRCKDGAVEVCEAGAWTTSEVCSVTCEMGVCVSQCSAGAAQCNGDRQLQECTGAEYVDAEECEFLCKDGACVGACEPDARRCDPDEGNAAQVCSAAGEWTASISCGDDAFCVAGACKPCMPGTRRCGKNGPQQCDDAGEWVDQGACAGSNPVCVEGACVACAPGTRRCMENVIQACRPDGSGFEMEEACRGETPACIEATLACGSCQQGDTQCSGDTVQTCGSDGTWMTSKECSDDAPECVKGVCKACDPGVSQRRCRDEQSAQACAAEGTWGETRACSGATPVCRADRNFSCGCREGERRCQGDTPQRCQGGAWIAEEPCLLTVGFCLPSKGACVECKPGDEECRSGVAYECTPEGAWASLNSCAGEQVNCGGCDLGESCEGDDDCASTHCVEGVCRAQEDCGNGKDDDANGATDCDDPACDEFTCVDPVPTGWQGPVVMIAGEGAACAGAYGTPVYRGDTDLTFEPARCSRCACAGPPTRCRVDGAWATSTDGSCSGTPLLLSQAGAGECLSPTFTPNEYTARRGVRSLDNCGATTGGESMFGPPSFAERIQLCGESGAKGMCSSGVCVPTPPPSTTGPCIFSSGDKRCPAGFPERHVSYTSQSDTRGCSPCRCAGDCGVITFEYFSDESCGAPMTRGTLDEDGSTVCTADGMPRSAKFIASAPTCAASGGEPMGTVTPTGATTVCCQ